MKKKDLKTGMIVRTNEGELRVMLAGTAIGVGKSGGIINDRINSDLTVDCGDRDITHVYSEPQKATDLSGNFEFWLKDDNILKHCELLWERQPPQEMTLEEVNKELGYKVKIIE